MTIFSSVVSQKGQVTLPKTVRAILRIKKAGEIVGFMVDGNNVRLTRAKIVPDNSLTAGEIDMLAGWSKKRKGRLTFKNSKDALKFLWSL